MARLILLNGAPGTGKSTLARRYVDDHPLALALDVDLIRAMLGGWLDHPAESGRAARALAIEMARAHVHAGYDVIVAQYVGRIDFIDQLDRLGREVGVPFVETALLADAADVVARFTRRSTHPDVAAHRDAAVLQHRDGGSVADAVTRLAQVTAQRPRTRFVRSVDGQVDLTYGAFLDQVGQ